MSIKNLIMNITPMSNDQNDLPEQMKTVAVLSSDEAKHKSVVNVENQASVMSVIELSTNSVQPAQENIDEITSDHKETFKESVTIDNINTPSKGLLQLSPVSPNIFESAVQVVKNLFSPVKGAGIFARGLPQSLTSELETKSNLNEELLLQEKSATSQEKLLLLVGKASSVDLSSVCENDASNSNLRNRLSSIDSTNDSYNSTGSRLDESFKSTVTHFDDCLQKPQGTTENLDNSINRTMSGEDSILNNTLKNLSTCSGEKLNDTVEVEEPVNYQDPDVKEKDFIIKDNFDEEVKYAVESAGYQQLTEENLKQFETESFGSILLDQAENMETFASITKVAEDDRLSQYSTQNQFSDCSVFSGSSENVNSAKTSEDTLMKNISTSTIILFKEEADKANVNNLLLKKENEVDKNKIGNINNSPESNPNYINLIFGGNDTSDIGSIVQKTAVESSIPLASQKSYTVLHNMNPELSRPVVSNSANNIEFNDINTILDMNDGLVTTKSLDEELLKTESLNIIKPWDESKQVQDKIESNSEKDGLLICQSEKENLDPNSISSNNPKGDATLKSSTVMNTSEIRSLSDAQTVTSSNCKTYSSLPFHNVRELTTDFSGTVNDNSSANKSDNLEDDHIISTELAENFEKLKLNESVKDDILSLDFNTNIFQSFGKANDCHISEKENYTKTEVAENELSQLIQEQFTPTDIETICGVVDDEFNLSKNILMASHIFDKSFHEKTIEKENANDNPFVGLDFLQNIKGKPGRDYSRESLFTKFDPLLSKRQTELCDVEERDKENLALPINNTAEPLVAITPLKETTKVNSPASQKLSAEKLNKLRELQNEITTLKETYLLKEEQNKERMNNYENEILRMTAKVCHLEEKLKESEETNKSLAKKLNSHNESVNRFKSIVEEYFLYIEKLMQKLESSKNEISAITEERDYYMKHLQNTEQAFSFVHSKYEKCKEAVELFKKNEEFYKANIDDLKDRIESYSEKIRDLQESAAKEVGRLQEKMNDLKLNHAQEISRYKAQLRKTEIRAQSIQEALDQKIKENQELAGICDDLIGGNKCAP